LEKQLEKEKKKKKKAELKRLQEDNDSYVEVVQNHDGVQLQQMGAFATGTELERARSALDGLEEEDWESLQTNHADTTNYILEAWLALANHRLETEAGADSPTLRFGTPNFGNLLITWRSAAQATKSGATWCDLGRMAGLIHFVFVVHFPSHWVLVDVNVADHAVNLWDSNGRGSSKWPEKLINSKYLAAFLDAVYPSDGDEVWDFIRQSDAPRQHDGRGGSGRNCGIFVVEFARFFMLGSDGSSMEGVREEDMVANRAHIVAELKRLVILEK
jgi:hypothetical protein